MPNAFSNAPKVNTRASAAMSVRRREEPDTGAPGIRHQFAGGRTAEDADIIVRAGLDAFQTECAVHVAGFAGLKQGQLAAALNHHQIGSIAPAADAVFRGARNANTLVAHLHLERRKRGCHEIELPDGTNKFAKHGVFEETVDYQDCSEVGHDQPRGPPGRRPEIEQLVDKKDQREERRGEPLVTQFPGPGEPRAKKAPRPLADQHERTSHAEQIAGA